MNTSLFQNLTHGLEFRILKTNSERLIESTREAIQGAVEDVSKLTLNKLNQSLWTLNRPITKLNQWLSSKRHDRRKAKKKYEQASKLEREIERMEGEGSAATPPPASPPELL